MSDRQLELVPAQYGEPIDPGSQVDRMPGEGICCDCGEACSGGARRCKSCYLKQHEKPLRQLKCPDCGLTRTVSHQAYSRARRLPVLGRCHPCGMAAERAKTAARTHKYCANCRETKPLEQFYRSARCPDGRGWRCKPCAKAHWTKLAGGPWNVKALRNARYARNQGHTTRVDYEAVFARGFTCHICREPVTPDDGSFDHVVPFVRGGKHVTENVYLAHRDCNARKAWRLPEEM